MKKKTFVIGLIILTILLAIGSVYISYRLKEIETTTPEQSSALLAACSSGQNGGYLFVCESSISGCPSGQIYSCQDRACHSSNFAHACAPIMSSGRSCSGLTNLGYGPWENGKINFVGCNYSSGAPQNCFCLSGMSGSVTCSTDSYGWGSIYDSCGARYIGTPPTNPPSSKISCGDYGCQYDRDCEGYNSSLAPGTYECAERTDGNASLQKCVIICAPGQTRNGDCACGTTSKLVCGDLGCTRDSDCEGYDSSFPPGSMECAERTDGNASLQRCVIVCGEGTTKDGYCACVTTTPSVSPSISPSETPSVTPSETPTLTPTETPTLTPSVSPSLTITETPTPTLTPSVSITTTLTISPSGSITPTGSTTRIPQTALINDEVDRIIIGMTFIILGFAIYKSGAYLVLGNTFWTNGGKSMWKSSSKYLSPSIDTIFGFFIRLSEFVKLQYNKLLLKIDKLILGTLKIFRESRNYFKNIGLSKKEKFEKDLLKKKKHE